MPNSYDPSEDIRHRITGRIDALAGALPHAAPTQIVQGIDEIRCLARDHGFTAVEMLASRLESTVAAGGYRAATRPYLDALSDAAAAPRGPLPVAQQEAWLASGAMRPGMEGPPDTDAVMVTLVEGMHANLAVSNVGKAT